MMTELIIPTCVQVLTEQRLPGGLMTDDRLFGAEFGHKSLQIAWRDDNLAAPQRTLESRGGCPPRSSAHQFPPRAGMFSFSFNRTTLGIFGFQFVRFSLREPFSYCGWLIEALLYTICLKSRHSSYSMEEDLLLLYFIYSYNTCLC